MTTTEQAAYMAGALDGEGHIAVVRNMPDVKRDRPSARYSFAVTVTNTNKPWLETLRQWFGGVLTAQNKVRQPRHRECYVLRFRQQEAISLIAAVMPYLVMKRRQAELLLAHFDLATRRRLESRPGQLTNAEILAQQQALYEEVRSLNLSRPHADQSWRVVDAVCSVSECGRKHCAKGYCWKHYRKYVIRGGPAFYELKCQTCGRDFVARRSDAGSCSKPCADKKYYAKNADKIKAQVAARAKRMQEQT